MKKLFLLLMIAAGIVLARPEKRGDLERFGRSSVAWVGRAAGPRLRPLLDPVLTWSARGELRTLERDLKERQETFQPLPHPTRFRDHIRQNHLSGRDGLDPWGGEYYLVITLDSIIVGSPGADGIRDTEEDVRVSWLYHAPNSTPGSPSRRPSR